MRVSEKTELAIPLKNLIGIVVVAVAAAGGYFAAMQRITSLEHTVEMLRMDITQNSNFRIRWPRGELGSLPADARQDLLLESLKTEVARIDKRLEKVDDLQVRTKLLEQKSAAQ